MKSTQLFILAMAGFLVLQACGRKQQAALNREVQLPYEVSSKQAVFKKDIAVHAFLTGVQNHPPERDKVPSNIKQVAEREIKAIRTTEDLSEHQKRMNWELIYFHLLDRYLLPVYRNTGNKEVEEQILSCLVHLKKLQSFAELHLQARSLHAISQGGYYYPELQDHLSSVISQQYAIEPRQELEDARALIVSLKDKAIN